jgi:diguanylate cyclase (GGDEF)-like protein
VRSLRLAYEPLPPELPASAAITAGAAVPIHGELAPIGLLSVFARGPAHGFGESQVRDLETLAARAGPAIENARRFREARHLADVDALTGLHNRRYFHETLAREVARAQRYDRRLALVVFDLDNFKEINDSLGHLAGDSVLAELAERLRHVIRQADIACRVGGDEFAVILPESGLHEADQLYERISSEVTSRPIAQTGSLGLSAGVAELRPQDDPTRFFQRADANLYTAKGAGKARLAGDPVAAPQRRSAISGIESLA